MSTTYTIEPNISYETILQTTSVEVQEPPQIVYMHPHKVLHSNGSYIYIFDVNGITTFERCGINNIDNIFPKLTEEFCIRFTDQYGLPYPEPE